MEFVVHTGPGSFRAFEHIEDARKFAIQNCKEHGVYNAKTESYLTYIMVVRKKGNLMDFARINEIYGYISVGCRSPSDLIVFVKYVKGSSHYNPKCESIYYVNKKGELISRDLGKYPSGRTFRLYELLKE